MSLVSMCMYIVDQQFEFGHVFTRSSHRSTTSCQRRCSKVNCLRTRRLVKVFHCSVRHVILSSLLILFVSCSCQMSEPWLTRYPQRLRKDRGAPGPDGMEESYMYGNLLQLSAHWMTDQLYSFRPLDRVRSVAGIRQVECMSDQ